MEGTRINIKVLVAYRSKYGATAEIAENRQGSHRRRAGGRSQAGRAASSCFHGKVDPQKLNTLERMAIKKVDAPSGDSRDWEAIDAWAAGIAGELKE